MLPWSTVSRTDLKGSRTFKKWSLAEGSQLLGEALRMCSLVSFPVLLLFLTADVHEDGGKYTSSQPPEENHARSSTGKL